MHCSPPTDSESPDLSAGSDFAFVSHTGEVFPSGFLPLMLGNIRTQGLADIYRHSPLLRALRNPDALLGCCGRCEYRRICGGSRSRAYALCGSYLATDPWCSCEPAAVEQAGEAARPAV